MNSLYYQDHSIVLHSGDALQIMQTLPSESVQCVVTSPPYWGLRDYGTAVWRGGNQKCQHTLGATPHQRRTTGYRALPGNSTGTERRCRNCDATAHDQQYGLESCVEDYVARLQQVSREIGRVLAPRGTFWLNLRDGFSYHSSGTGRTGRMANTTTSTEVPHKGLMGIPWRVAFALQHAGWIVRNAIVWHKPNAIPDPTQERFSSRYEMVFLLVKQPDYHFDAAQAFEPLSQDRPARRKERRGGTKAHAVQTASKPRRSGKNAGDIWSMSTRPLPDAHCAPFPVDLPRRCIAAGCPVDGRVLDPFSGSGTTGIAARQLGRTYQGIDLRNDYHDIAVRRLSSLHTNEPAEPASGDNNTEKT